VLGEMSYPEDREAYVQGYEDAMRAAGQAQTAESMKPREETRTGDRDVGGTFQRGIGTAIGWLVLFPIVMGVLLGGFAWLLGGDFSTWALIWGGLAFVFALFAGLFMLGWRLLLALWPIVLLGAVVLIVVKALD
jgi:hypothetical protein